MSNDSIKNKLVNSMKMTKAGTAKTTEASEKKEVPAAKAEKPAKKAAPRKKAAAKSAATSFSSGCRVWPD
jgi:hypothetical protein